MFFPPYTFGSLAIHGIVFAQCVSYIEDTKIDSNVSPVFTLSERTTLYTQHLLRVFTATGRSSNFNDISMTCVHRKMAGKLFWFLRLT